MKTTTETLTDNSVEQHKALAAFILKNAPAGLHVRLRDQLAEIANTGAYDRTIFLEFRRPDVTADVSVGFSEGLGRIEDAAGSIFRVYKLTANVTFSGHGATEPMLALRRLALMQECAVFALMLEREFSAPLYELSATKAEREAAAESERKRANVEKLRAHLANSGDVLRGMRVGDDRAFFVQVDVPEGNYELTTGKHAFRVAADRVHGGDEMRLTVSRTA